MFEIILNLTQYTRRSRITLIPRIKPITPPFIHSSTSIPHRPIQNTYSIRLTDALANVIQRKLYNVGFRIDTAFVKNSVRRSMRRPI